MCGTVGLFTGCAAAAFCPMSQMQADRDSDLTKDASDQEYKSAFDSWDVRASVRSAPRRLLRTDQELALFPMELVPIASHPLVQRLGPEVLAEILARQMYRYLHFTAKLEYLVVNHVVLGIANGDVQVPIPEEMRFDAFRIYCDEAYHAYFSVDLIRQAEKLTKFTAVETQTEPYFLSRLRALQNKHDANLASLVELVFTIVSETLISATLTDVARGSNIDPAVTDTVRDHALDEGRHHAYFAAYLRYLWGSLSAKERIFAGRLFPQLIDVFLDPDRDSISRELKGYGMPRDQRELVLAEVFSVEVRRLYNRATASKLVAYLRDIDVFDDSVAFDSAVATGLFSESEQ